MRLRSTRHRWCLDCKPRQSQRHRHRHRRTQGNRRHLHETPGEVDLRRNLSRHHLWAARSNGACVLRRCGRDQQFFEILLDDGLADRLDGRAEALVRPIERLTQNFYISPATISQTAALAALDANEELDGHVRTYARNRERLLKALGEAGFGTIAPADGAFYVYANVSPFRLDATAFTKALLDETGVAATPGNDFDPVEGDRWVRFSYAGSANEVDRAADALRTWCAKRRQLPMRLFHQPLRSGFGSPLGGVASSGFAPNPNRDAMDGRSAFASGATSATGSALGGGGAERGCS